MVLMNRVETSGSQLSKNNLKVTWIEINEYKMDTPLGKLREILAACHLKHETLVILEVLNARFACSELIHADLTQN